MSRYLIVANQTLGGDSLTRAVEERIERGDSQFYVVVPKTATKDEATGWSGGFDEASSGQDKTHSKAEHRLSLMLDKIRSSGGEADGEVGDADPKVAVEDVLRTQSFDEIIVSTLPTGLSGWLKADVSSQVARAAGKAVTTVTAER